MRRLLPSLLFLILISLNSAFGAAQAYYPNLQGLRWTYSSGEAQQLSGPREVNGQQVMVLTHFFEGVPVSEDYLLFDQAVQSLGTAAGGQTLLYTPGLVVYGASPLEIGQQWQSTTKVADLSITLTSEVLAIRGVETPAGRFNALQIRQRTITSTGGKTVLDLYFVPGVGVVRFVTQDGTIIDLIEKNF